MNTGLRTTNSQTFGSLYINTSKMTAPQRKLSDKVADIVSISKLYKEADDRNIDIYILPHTKNPENIIIRYIDGWSDNFYRKNGKILQTIAQKDEISLTVANRVKKQLDKILNGKLPYPVGNPIKAAHGECDLAELRPDLF